MKLNHHLLTAILSTGILTASAFADGTASQTVTYEVKAINELAVSDATASLTVDSATAGGAPNAAVNSSTTYSITTNETGRKITGSLDSSMPDGVILAAHLAQPSGATSLGFVALSAAAQDLVTGISTLNQSGLGIDYRLTATSAAGVVPSASKTVTLTITAGE